jgi:hypothetical protein
MSVKPITKVAQEVEAGCRLVQRGGVARIFAKRVRALKRDRISSLGPLESSRERISFKHKENDGRSQRH